MVSNPSAGVKRGVAATSIADKRCYRMVASASLAANRRAHAVAQPVVVDRWLAPFASDPIADISGLRLRRLTFDVLSPRVSGKAGGSGLVSAFALGHGGWPLSRLLDRSDRSAAADQRARTFAAFALLSH